jgi:hypothetical protein
MSLRAVLFGLDGILVKENGRLHPDIINDLQMLFEYLRINSIKPIILSNRSWTTVDRRTGVTRPIGEWLDDLYGKLELHEFKRLGTDLKQSRSTLDRILQNHNLSNTNVIYVGVSKSDFQAAVNANLIFLNAIWDRQDVSYGLIVSSPVEVGRFISVFCLKKYLWFYKIDNPICYRSLGPFSTFIDAYKRYSEIAKRAAKDGTSERYFFLHSITTSLYFSGMVSMFDYIACVPGHKAGYGNSNMDDILDTVAKFFRKRYLRDLILRHTDAPKSQFLRHRGKKPNPLDQLNTICLSKFPQKAPNDRYKQPLSLVGKRILLVDDFCTSGYSLEAARLFLRQAGADTIEVSWLKTVNTNYEVLELNKSFDPYKAQSFTSVDLSIKHLFYNNYIVDRSAPLELGEALRRYRGWTFSSC